MVTSEGATALKVIQSKIPEEIRALTVALISDERDSLRQFQGSIEHIQHTVSHLNIESVQNDIDQTKEAIDHAHSEIITIENRMNDIAKAHLSGIEIDGQIIKTQRMAELVVSGESQYGWFDDELSLSAEHAPPLEESEVAHLRHARRVLEKDLIYTNCKLPSYHEYPEYNEIGKMHSALCKIHEVEKGEKLGNILQLHKEGLNVLPELKCFLEKIENALCILQDLSINELNWTLEFREKCNLSEFALEIKALESLFLEINTISEKRAQFLSKPISFPDDKFDCDKTRKAVFRASIKSKPFFITVLSESSLKKTISSIKILRESPNSKEDWAYVMDYILLNDKIIQFSIRWNEIANILSLPSLNGGILNIREYERILNVSKKIYMLSKGFDDEYESKVKLFFGRTQDISFKKDINNLQLMHFNVSSHILRLELATYTNCLNTIREKLTGCTGPIIETFSEFLEKDMGNDNFDSHSICLKYSNIINELKRLSGLSSELLFISEMASKIELAGAAKLANRICKIPILKNDEDTIFPINWKEAWNWARMKSHLLQIEARNEFLDLSVKLKRSEDVIARLYKKYISNISWLSLKKNVTPKIMQALQGYATAMRRIGKGLGANAVRYRRDAQSSMNEAAASIPCWIMNRSRISESMPADIGYFDLVIIDEASQSDIWVMLAVLRGKKVLVVGDDKQVSPRESDAKIVENLTKQYLVEQPFGSAMAPGMSFYDLSARVFSSDQVMLREHFRCAPAIIEYSNQNFYQGSIKPLRIPNHAERIDPPLVDVYIKNGYRGKDDTNTGEAKFIAEEIQSILNNKNFKNRTIGVISLFGPKQANFIRDIVNEKCDISQLMERQFECGDAATFQGNERDIIFISIVVDKDNCRALSGNMYDQKFNVAASRARDRMYLVRSVKMEELSDKDIRCGLLAHFQSPLTTNESKDLINLCESDFEKDVYSSLCERGYRVIPQVQAGGYRIDMVVESAGDARLAIECDGDIFHGPDKWQQDMSRQKTLERAGWTFWRCFASTWVMKKEEVFEELLRKLSQMDIHPVGVLDAIPGLVEYRTIEPERERSEQVNIILENAFAE